MHQAVEEPYAIVSTEEMRALERAAMDAGVSEAQLQEHAGQQVALVTADVVGAPSQAPVVALVGPGNNGRDAMVAARSLAREGYPVALYAGPRHSVTAGELDELAGLGCTWTEHGREGAPPLIDLLVGAAAVIDGLLGIGVRGPMRSPLSEMAEDLGAARRDGRGAFKIISVDVPSGIDSDRGDAAGAAVQADVTVALGAVKAGTMRFPGAALAGRIEPRPIGLPPGATSHLPVRLMQLEHARGMLPARPLAAHKGTLGMVLVVGGSRDYIGAPILSALGAARGGCGLVGMAVPRNVMPASASRLPEAIYQPLPGDGAASDPEASLQAISEMKDRADALLVGPGLGRSEGANKLVRGLLAGDGWRVGPPVVVDADALYHLAGWPDWWRETRRELVLTPHHAEMARLADQPTESIDRAAWETAQAKARHWGQVVVLKSALTVVAEPGGRAWVSPWANPALATGGSGDVLSGLIAGLLAQGVDRASACRLAVTIQAYAARTLLDRRGWATLLASDLAEEIPRAIRELG